MTATARVFQLSFACLLTTVLASPSATASIARSRALGQDEENVQAVTTADDIQDIFLNPSKIFNFSNLVTVEYSAQPQGGVIVANGDQRYGFYVGGKSTTLSTTIFLVNMNPLFGAGNFLDEQTPFEIFYGAKTADLAWALSFKASTAQDKTAQKKVDVAGLRGGVTTSAYEAYAILGLFAQATNDTTSTKIKGDGGIRFGGEYFIGDSTAYLDVHISNASATSPAIDMKIKMNNIQVGYETKVVSEGYHFFSGAKLDQRETTIDTIKFATTKLPVYAGVEGDALSWLQLRGFISQSLLPNSVKQDAGLYGPAVDSSGLDNAATGLGATIRFGKLSVDGLLSASGTGLLATDNLLTQTSLNYRF